MTDSKSYDLILTVTIAICGFSGMLITESAWFAAVSLVALFSAMLYAMTVPMMLHQSAKGGGAVERAACIALQFVGMFSVLAQGVMIVFSKVT